MKRLPKTICKLLFIIFLLTFCKQKNGSEIKRDAPQSLKTIAITLSKTAFIYPKKDSAQHIFYLNKYHTVKDLDTLKSKELQKWELELTKTYNKKFAFKHANKYFNVAYQCSDAQINQLIYFATIFFKDTYPLYFSDEPKNPFQIVYFADKSEFVKSTASESYGFYQPRTKTLFTYINSGEGTLWHELVHAFVDTNIDHNIQQWFSEGLASFYEMGAIGQNGFVEGYTNWRMPLLQQMLLRNDYLPLTDFLGEERMTEHNAYAKARFLFCYLWRYKKIIPFTKLYLYELSPKYKGKELTTKTIATLQKLLRKDIKAIEKEYKEWAKQYTQGQKLERVSNNF